jgi:hypothetical protein
MKIYLYVFNHFKYFQHCQSSKVDSSAISGLGNFHEHIMVGGVRNYGCLS